MRQRRIIVLYIEREEHASMRNADRKIQLQVMEYGKIRIIGKELNFAL